MGVAAKARCAFVFLMVLTLGVSLGLPAEDVLENVYDESETVPCEVTPLFSIVVPQASARVASAEFDCGPLTRFNFFTKRCAFRPENGAESRCILDSLTIINHSLRC